jgi:hypothetical protein
MRRHHRVVGDDAEQAGRRDADQDRCHDPKVPPTSTDAIFGRYRVTADWTHLPMISAPFADFTWRHARRLAAQTGRDDTNETEVARVLDELLTRAGAGPQVHASLDKTSARVAARTRVAAAAHRPPPHEVAEPDEEDELYEKSPATVVPMGIFDARAEAERWPFDRHDAPTTRRGTRRRYGWFRGQS